MSKLTKRQQNILKLITRKGQVSNMDIRKYLKKLDKETSRMTIFRDISKLQNLGLIRLEGNGRGVYYTEEKSKLLKYIDVEKYFKLAPDKRSEVNETFNFDIYKNLRDVFSREELEKLNDLNSSYKKRVKKLSKTVLKKEFERLIIEFSWKSSRIEGNTYSLIETEVLLKELKEAKGHSKEEARMILNHKKALDYIMDKKSDFKKLSLRKIENIHELAIKGLRVPRGLRKRPVGIVGTRYKPLDNQYQIREALINTVKSINRMKDPFSKSLTAIAMISYIQPFEDGNKRTGRLLGNAILTANNVCPLSFRSVDEGEYKKGIILFYEKNSLRYFKKLFVEQFRFAIDNYFRA